MAGNKKQSNEPFSPLLSLVLLLSLLLVSYFAAALGSISPIDFIYEGI